MVSRVLICPTVVLGFLSGLAGTGIETDAVADVTMVVVDGGLEVSTVGVTVVEDERRGTVQDVDRGQ